MLRYLIFYAFVDFRSALITMDNFSLLPLELKEYIFTFLPGKDLWTCLGVCTEWRRLANFNKQWKNICCYEHIDLYDPDEGKDSVKLL